MSKYEKHKHVWMSWYVPGLGQIIKGHVAKGILIMSAFALSLTLPILILRLTESVLLAVIVISAGLILWCWNIYDAFTS